MLCTFLSLRRPKFSRISVPALRFRLKMCHRHISFTPKPSRVQVLFIHYQNKNGYLTVTVSALAGAEGLVLACRLGRRFCAYGAKVSTGHPRPTTRSACLGGKLSLCQKEKRPHCGHFLFVKRLRKRYFCVFCRWI